MPKSGTFIRTTLVLALATVVAALSVSAAGASPAKRNAGTLQGAGSSLVAPLLALWGPAYQSAKGVQVNYASVGSGAGIAAITARTVDFGASDAPFSADQSAACNGCLQIPWALSATVPTYNIPGIKDIQLRLNGPVLANIFLGSITKWNDPRIARLNPSLNLPDMNITVAHRSDGSGDTFAFTDYLSKVSPQWKSQVGSATAVNWPVGVGGKGNSGVAAVIAQTPGSIGYISVAYVLQNHLSKARMRNQFGHYTLPSIKSIAQAASTVKSVPNDNRMSITNPPKNKKFKDSWPLSTFTYILLPRQTANAAELKAFVQWAITSGQAKQYLAKLVFAPIPKVVEQAAVKTLAQIHS
ncbi:MAG TPA: phosphate ABC transporter substrate-binding protein PstS [Gaiellaceae bacterium]|nr:phosphate ABC transporter substrate-binding protein PstS [Gaiellaceae bacterium]